MESLFEAVDLLEPDKENKYPRCSGLAAPSVIFFHAPSLHDRIRPWNPFLSVIKLKIAFPRALFISIVHEFSEAPSHWKARQAALLRLGDGVIVNSQADFYGVRGLHKNVLRSRLGPTLFIPALLENGSPCGEKTMQAAVGRARTGLAKRFELGLNEKWILHPGLLTPGKGVNFLDRLAPLITGDVRLIIMGGQGPKSRDRAFAARVLSDMHRIFGDRVSILLDPDDGVFRDMLLASDLVVLPYDAGLSERRSSFLSAASCGANVWTTTGRFSSVMGLDRSGAHCVSVDSWNSKAEADLQNVTNSLANALTEDTAKRTHRRLLNVKWATERSWGNRVADVDKFIASLMIAHRKKR